MELEPVTPVDDLCLIDDLNAKSLLELVKSRFEQQSAIFTWAGPVLLSLNPFTQFVEDCQLSNKISKACRKADLDRAFIAADAASGKLEKDLQDDGGNRGKALSPEEFMLCVVNIAIMKYVLEGTMSDVSDSVCMLFREEILPKVDPDALLPPNHFRTTQCYHESVDATLRAHEASLAMLFKALAEPRGPAKKLLSFKAWSSFLRQVQLIGVVSVMATPSPNACTPPVGLSGTARLHDYCV